MAPRQSHLLEPQLLHLQNVPKDQGKETLWITCQYYPPLFTFPSCSGALGEHEEEGEQRCQVGRTGAMALALVETGIGLLNSRGEKLPVTTGADSSLSTTLAFNY